MSTSTPVITDNSPHTTYVTLMQFMHAAMVGIVSPPPADYDPDERSADEDRPVDALVCPDCNGEGEICVHWLDMYPCTTCGATGEVIF